MPLLAWLGAVGWEAGGMTGYGRIVGFGRAADFGNVLFGLAVLGVVEARHGFIGGGIFVLGLETTDSKKPDWARLLTEMAAWRFLAWGILIYQFDWKVTSARPQQRTRKSAELRG